jgi:molybdopterin converting factor subunit 1
MDVEVRLFAGARDAVGAGARTVSLPDGATAGAVLAQLVREYPALARLARVAKLAVNGEYVDGDAPVRPGDEVAILPPVSGGA